MRLIKEIYEEDLDLGTVEPGERCYRLRRAARALIFHGNKIAMLNATKLNLHKLPGGGIGKFESEISGLRREILEETGCTISNIRELGITIEYRDTIEMLQISYVFKGSVEGTGAPKFTQKEIDEGFQLVWLDPGEAIKIMKMIDKPNTYAGKFIHARDLAIIEYYTGL